MTEHTDDRDAALIEESLMNALPATHEVNLGRWARGKTIRSADVVSFADGVNNFLLEARNHGDEVDYAGYSDEFAYEVELVADTNAFDAPTVVAAAHVNDIDSILLFLDLFAAAPHRFTLPPEAINGSPANASPGREVAKFVPDPDSDHAIHHGWWGNGDGDTSIGYATNDAEGEYAVDVHARGLEYEIEEEHDVPFVVSLSGVRDDDRWGDVYAAANVRNGEAVLDATDLLMKATRFLV